MKEVKELFFSWYTLIFAITLVGLVVIEGEAQRGDLYGARAIQSLEQLLNADGVTYIQTGDGITTITAGQLLLPFGTAAIPSIAFTGNLDTGIWGTASEFRIAIGGVSRFRFLNTGLISVHNGAPTLVSYAAGNDAGTGLYYVGTNNMGMSAGGALVMDWEDTNAAGAGADLATISSTLGIMDGAPDFVRGLTIALTNVNHTGGNVYGLDIPALAGTGADIDALEAAARLDASWDYALLVDGTTQDIDDGLTTTVMLSPTLAANDNANDQRNILTIDVDIPDGTAGLVNGINIDGVTDDANTIDSAIFVEGGWDSAITITEAGHAFTSNPLTGSVYITLDDSTDYSGAGGNDCWLVLRDAGGNNFQIVEVVLNGACP